MFLFICFKSSSVLARIEFKYISCSYLSKGSRTYQKKGEVFKYISCSYLSDAAEVACGAPDRLNTSHVLIYRRKEPVNVIPNNRLNTSHVLIYRI